MKNIVAKELVENSLGRWHPEDLAFILEMNYKCREWENYSEMTMDSVFQKKDRNVIAWPSNSHPFFFVRILFLGVQGLKLNGWGCAPLQVSGFSIEDISSKGWENKRYQVEDYENGVIFFFCSTIEILDAHILKNFYLP